MISKRFRILGLAVLLPLSAMGASIPFDYTRNCSAFNVEDSQMLAADILFSGYVYIQGPSASFALQSRTPRGLTSRSGYARAPNFPVPLYADTDKTSIGDYLASHGGDTGVVSVPLYGQWGEFWSGWGYWTNHDPAFSEWEYFGELTYLDGVPTQFTPGNLPKDYTIEGHDRYTNDSSLPERVTWTWIDENGETQSTTVILKPGETANFDISGVFPGGSVPKVRRTVEIQIGQCVNPKTGEIEDVWDFHHEQVVPLTKVELPLETEREMSSTVSISVDEKPYSKPDPDNPNDPGNTNPDDPNDPSGQNLDALNDTLKSIKAEIEVLEKIGVDQLDDQQRGMFDRLKQLQLEAETRLSEREAEMQGPERQTLIGRIKGWGDAVLEFVDAVTVNPFTLVQNKYQEMKNQVTWASVLGSSPAAMQQWVSTGSAIPESFPIVCGPINKTLKIPYTAALKPFLNSVRALLVLVCAFLFLRWVFLGTLACFAGGIQVAGSSGATTVELHPSIAGVSLGAIKGPVVSLVAGVALWAGVISVGWLMVAGALEQFSFLQAVLAAPSELGTIMNSFAGAGSFEVGGGSFAWGGIFLQILDDTFPVGFAISCFLTGRVVAIFAIFAPVFGVTAATSIWLKSVT